MNVQNEKKQLVVAVRCAYSRMALNFYMYSEILAENRPPEGEEAACNQELLRLMSLFLKGELEIPDLAAFRERVIHWMELNTAYVGCFQVYEYVFNRLEGRFPNGDDSAAADPKENDRERLIWLIQYITDSSGASLPGQRIRNAAGQMPIRLTKQKFFALVRKGLEAYRGSGRRELENIMYVLRLGALLDLPEDMEEFSPRMSGILARFRQADYKNMTKDVFRELSASLEAASGQLGMESDRISLLMDLINDLYVLALARDSAFCGIKEPAGAVERSAGRVLSSVMDFLARGGEASLDETMLESLEGTQETCWEQWEACASPMDLLEEACGQDPQAELLRRIHLLLSGSSFMSLELQEIADETVDGPMLDRVCGEFFTQLAASWENQPRPVVRAVMAQIFSSLPVCFSSLDEATQYLSGCLSSCADETEKAVSMRMIRKLAMFET